ncbi:MAG: hypothetical protein Q9M25_04630 [Mariprofundaceae bacterium]|nr:hypothetical protein [Mariprofundaceae bacterium]
MKGLFAVVLTVFFMFAGGGMAFADSAPSCNKSQLVCISLENLGDPDPENVVHPCTTFDAAPGAWVCPGTENLPDKDGQSSLQPSSGNNFRDLMGQ